MRKALRVTFSLLAAFLVQSTVLPYFKAGGVLLDLVTVALFTAGYALGPYAGVTAGLFAALLMESLTGDLGGLAAVACVASGAVGAWAAARLKRYVRPGNRLKERIVRQFGPMVLVGLFVMGKESVNVVYFYLTGVDVSFVHAFRVVFAGCWAALWSLLLIPALVRFLLRKPEETFVAKWAAKRRARVKPEPAAKKTAAPEALAAEKGGSDV